MRAQDQSRHSTGLQDTNEARAGNGGPGEAAGYIRSALMEMAQMAHRHNLGLLCHLLNMALLEAGEIMRRQGSDGGR